MAATAAETDPLMDASYSWSGDQLKVTPQMKERFEDNGYIVVRSAGGGGRGGEGGGGKGDWSC